MRCRSTASRSAYSSTRSKRISAAVNASKMLPGMALFHHGDQGPRHHLSFGTRRILAALDGTRQRFGVGHMRGQQGFPNARRYPDNVPAMQIAFGFVDAELESHCPQPVHGPQGHQAP